jgi:hypothetical protein
MNPELSGEPEPVLEPGSNAAEQEPADAHTEDLTGSLTALAGLSTARLSLEDLLTRVASFAVRAIPGADGAGLTLLETGRSATIVKSAPFVRDIDDIQYGIGEGPCISAAETGQTMRSGKLGGDPRWPRFGPRAGRLGVHSVLSLPLLVDERVADAGSAACSGGSSRCRSRSTTTAIISPTGTPTGKRASRPPAWTRSSSALVAASAPVSRVPPVPVTPNRNPI